MHAYVFAFHQITACHAVPLMTCSWQDMLTSGGVPSRCYTSDISDAAAIATESMG
jgi:hypothetical protein